MRERAVTTSVIWIALAVSTGLLLNSVRYTELVASPSDANRFIEQTAFASTPWQIGVGLLIFMLIGCAMGATIAIWQSAAGSTQQSIQQTEKAKRDNRDARIRRLLASMDDDDLDLLEQGGIDPEGERLSLEALLRKRD